MKTISRRSLLGSSPAFALHRDQPRTHRLVRDLPVEDGYDLLVAGGGPAGAAAAICAARLGARVLVAEATGCLGGMGTSGLMMSFCPMGDGTRCLAGGLMLEIVEALYARGFLKPGIDPNQWRRNFGSWVPFNAEGLKLLLDELAVAAGVTVRFFTRVIDAESDPRSGRVLGAVTHDIEGYRYIRASAFIDATGDAVLSTICGAACREAGHDTPGIMPPTLVSLCSGIDWSRMGNQQQALQRAAADRFFRRHDPHLPGLQQIGQHIALMNAGHIFNLDALRQTSMTSGMMAGRQLAQEFVAFYRKYVPGCEDMEHVTTAPLMGVRESRCVLGEYELGLADYRERRHFPDQIGVYNYSIDIHAANLTPREYKEYWNEFHKTGRMKPGESVGLPYRMLVPKGWKNLWVAGRCASMDVKVHGAFRVQPAAYMMGQAAGTAAVQSVRTSRPAAEIDIGVLVNTLRKAGAFIPNG